MNLSPEERARRAELARRRNFKHGARYTSEWVCWFNMNQRCYNKNHKAYKNYGARGISVCERWRHSFQNFRDDMGVRPSDLELDRINNDGNYEPTNCRWATRSTQASNRRPRSRNKIGQYSTQHS